MKREIFSFSTFATALVVAIMLAGFCQAQSSVLVAQTVAPEAEAEEAEAGAVVDTGAQSEEPKVVLTYVEAEPSIKVGGWIQAGGWANEHGNPEWVENGPLSTNVQNTGIHAQQVWLFAEREVDTTYGADWGFRADLAYGSEMTDAQSWADGSFDGKWGYSGDGYALAMPRLYFEMGYENFRLKLGKFDTPLGYEVMDAPENVLFSHSHMYSREPLTHTGALLTWDATDRLSMSFGVTTGPDTGFENEYGDYGGLFSVTYQLTNKVSIGYAAMYNRLHGGEERPWTDLVDCSYPSYGYGYYTDANQFLQTFLFQWDITCRLSYVFQCNYGFAEARDVWDGEGHANVYNQVGINNTFLYQATDRLELAARFEWFRQDAGDMSNVDNVSSGTQTWYSVSLGARYKICENLTINPEVRYDWVFDNEYDYYPSGFGREMAEDTQLSGGASLVWTF